MKRLFLSIALLLCVNAAFAEDEIRLVYPTTAANAETLDSSTPAKRAVPPVRETSEDDPVTPIGQIRSVINSLNALEEGQQALSKDVALIRKRAGEDRTDEILAGVASNAATIQKFVSAIPKAQTTRTLFVDACIVFLACVVMLQMLGRIASLCVRYIKERAKERDEEIAARAYARAQEQLRNSQNV